MDQFVSNANLLKFSGKTAVVTGGAMGIGLGIAGRLAEAGANVMIADLSEADAEKSSADLNAKGFKSSYITVDVSNEEQVKAMVAKTVTDFGSVEILINNAGIFPSVPVSSMTSADFDRVINFSSLKAGVLS